MQAEKQQQTWNINVHAKARNFDFKFKATRLVPTWKFHRLSVLLKLRKFYLRMNSESTQSVPKQQQQKETLKSKFIRILKNTRIRCTRKRIIAVPKLPKPRYPEAESSLNRLIRYVYKEPISGVALFIGILSFLPQCIVHSLVILLFFSLLFNKYKTGRIRKLLVPLMVAAFVSPLVLDFNKHFKYYGKYASEFIGKAWKGAALLSNARD